MSLSLGHDLRYTLRMLRQSPGFTAVAVLSLALGIGANTAIFTLTDAILLRSLPVPNPQELVVLAGNPSEPSTGSSYPDYLYLRDHSCSYSGIIALWSGGVTRFSPGDSGGPSQLVALALVSGNYFQVLGVTPALGRTFNPADNQTQGAHPYVVLSHAFWKSALHGDAGAIGRGILLNGQRFEVVGVAREGFTGTNVGVSPQVFAPMVMERTFYRSDVQALTTRDASWITIMGRLKPGVRRASAEAELNVLWRQILASDPSENAKRSRQKNYDAINTRLLLPGSAGDSRLRRHVSRPLTILMFASGFLLLIACANVSSLLVARGVARQREMAVRLALGARRGRLVLQMLTESLTLGAMGTVAGLALAWLGVPGLSRFLPNDALSPLVLNLAPDVRFFGFVLSVTLFSCVLFGLAPAIQASGQDLLTVLRRDSTSRRSGRAFPWDPARLLVSVQVALSLMLLAGAGLFARTLANLRAVDLGLKPGNVVFIDTNMSQSGYRPQQAQTYFANLRDQTLRLPAVTAASMAVNNPFGNTGWKERIQFESDSSQPQSAWTVDSNAVGPRFFEVLGIPILLGRDFRDSDGAPTPSQAPPPRVAIVNDAFARRFFPGRSAIGMRFSLGDKWLSAQAYAIVGVVADARYESFSKEVGPMIYRPYSREVQWTGGVLCIRTQSKPGYVIGSVRLLAQELDPVVAVTEVRSLEGNLDEALLQQRFLATLGIFFGGVALMLAAVGIYGVMSQAVIRRNKEIGIRMALGAGPGKVLWMMLRDSLAMLAIGSAIGLLAGKTLAKYLESLLFGIKPHDPLSIAGALLLLLSVTVLAGFLPARRATRIQPWEALKLE